MDDCIYYLKIILFKFLETKPMIKIINIVFNIVKVFFF